VGCARSQWAGRYRLDIEKIRAIGWSSHVAIAMFRGEI
jgi:RNA:NAD 2'-phosphotransferase (TPT1/KptA family)